MPIDPERWPCTADFLRLYEKHEQARLGRAPTLAWAYGATLDRNDQARVPALVALAVRRYKELVHG